MGLNLSGRDKDFRRKISICLSRIYGEVQKLTERSLLWERGVFFRLNTEAQPWTGPECTRNHPKAGGLGTILYRDALRTFHACDLHKSGTDRYNPQYIIYLHNYLRTYVHPQTYIRV